MPAIVPFLRATYGGLPRATWLISVALLINRAGTMVMPFLAVYLGHRFGYSVAEAGLLLGIYGVGSVAGNLVGGTLTDRIGPVPVQVLSLTATGLWLWVLPFATTTATIAAGLFLLGILADSFRPGNMAAVVASCAPGQRVRALALNRLMINAGWGIGPVVGGVLATVDFRLLFAANGAVTLITAWFVHAFVPRELEPPAPAVVAGADAPAGSPRGAAPVASAATSPWSEPRFVALLVASTLLMLAFLQYFTTETRYWRDVLGLSPGTIGALLAINPLLIVLVELPLVHALRGRRQLAVVALGALLTGLCWPLLLPQDWGLGGVLASLLLLTIGEMLFWPLLTAFVSDVAPAARRGAYLGAYGATFSVAMVLAPAVGGWTFDELGSAWLWNGCLLLCAASAVAFWWLERAYRMPAPDCDPVITA